VPEANKDGALKGPSESVSGPWGRADGSHGLNGCLVDEVPGLFQKLPKNKKI